MTFTGPDSRLLNPPARAGVEGARRFAVECLYFGMKNARACLFAALLFAAVFLVPRAGVLGLPRYDVLLLIALSILAWMVLFKFESRDDLEALGICFVAGFVLEVFKTSSTIQSWSYPDVAYTKLFGVPLFAGFMYAAVGSYVIQTWRLFELCILRHPPYWMGCAVSIMVYANFFTQHYIGDYRLYIAACAAGMYARSTVVFRPMDRDRKMPLVLSFGLIGFVIWLAENTFTFFSLRRYLNPIATWSTVFIGKWSSWSLIVLIVFILVARLKFIKAHANGHD